MPFVFLSVQILKIPTLNSHTKFSSKSSTSILLHLSLSSSFIMSSLLLLLLLLFVLSLSVHACNARHLRDVGEENREVHLLSKVSGKADQGHKISLPPWLRPSIETAEELQLKLIVPVGSEKRNPLDGSEALSNQEDDIKGANSGDNIITCRRNTNFNTTALSSHEDSQQATKATEMEGWKKHSRLMLGTAPHDVEETVDSKEGDTAEDIAVMDYAQPHRKPPIHNKDP